MDRASASDRKGKVCIIGAGLSGLVAAKHFLHDSRVSWQVDVLEKESSLGGVWCYKPGTALYNSLVSNLPGKLMELEDFPHDSASEESTGFLHHTQFYSYLQRYADHFNVRRYIKFGTKVKSVKPVSRSAKQRNGDKVLWDNEAETSEIKTACTQNEDVVGVNDSEEINISGCNLQGMDTSFAHDSHKNNLELCSTVNSEPPERCLPSISTNGNMKLSPLQESLGEPDIIWDVDGVYYDIVIVANGHFEKPRSVTNVMDLSEMDPRRICNAVAYSVPDEFAGLRVLIVGAGPTGMDLSREVAKFAKVVYWSSRNFKDAEKLEDGSSKLGSGSIVRHLSSNMTLIGEVEKVGHDGLIHLKYTNEENSCNLGHMDSSKRILKIQESMEVSTDEFMRPVRAYREFPNISSGNSAVNVVPNPPILFEKAIEENGDIFGNSSCSWNEKCKADRAAPQDISESDHAASSLLKGISSTPYAVSEIPGIDKLPEQVTDKGVNSSLTAAGEKVENSLPAENYVGKDSQNGTACCFPPLSSKELIHATSNHPSSLSAVDTSYVVDRIILAVGYEYSFPFLEPKLRANMESLESARSGQGGKAVNENLHLILAHKHFPRSLFFMGLPFNVAPVSMIEAQVKLALSLCTNRIPTIFLKSLPNVFTLNMRYTQFYYVYALKLLSLVDASLHGDKIRNIIQGINNMLPSLLPERLFLLYRLFEDVSEKRILFPGLYKGFKYRVSGHSMSIEDEIAAGFDTKGLSLNDISQGEPVKKIIEEHTEKKDGGLNFSVDLGSSVNPQEVAAVLPH